MEATRKQSRFQQLATWSPRSSNTGSSHRPECGLHHRDDLGFGDVVNACVYRFNGWFARNAQRCGVFDLRRQPSPNPLTNAVSVILERAPNGYVDATGCATF
jgi:hypothetical protein